MEKYYGKILKGYNWIKIMFDNDELTIDQFNCIQNLCNNFIHLCDHYLEIVKEEMVDGETLEQRLARRPVANTKGVTHSTPVAITTPILIVGNPSFFSSYKQKLGEYGYDVTGIDGYESFSRVKQVAKDKEYIVVCTEFVSHDNMYAIKDFYPSSKVLYSERDGATQIALQLKSANM